MAEAKSRRILITGARGQLGQALARLCPDSICVGREELDITQPEAVRNLLDQCRPDVVINCAAWTKVDDATRQPEAAYRVNALGTQNLALAAARHRSIFLQISSNEVFDGRTSRPYFEYDATNPINEYGRSKCAAESIVRHVCANSFIVRTSWLTGPKGKNFVHRIQALAAEHGRVKVVTDEIASPTFVDDLAIAVISLLETDAYGIYHFVNQGHCSRLELAEELFRLTGSQVVVEPIKLADFQRPSATPHFSALANIAGASLGISLPPWQEALARFLRQK